MKQKIIFGIVLLIFSSCYYELSFPNEEISDIVVSSFIANDSLIKVDLLGITSVSDFSQKKYITDAEVKLYEDGVFVENLVLESDSYIKNGQKYTVYQYSTKETKAQIGKIYKIDIENPANKKVSASTIIPNMVALISVDTIFNYTVNDEENSMFVEETFKIRFSDPVGENYYRLTLMKVEGRLDENNNVVLNSQIYSWSYDQDTIFSYFDEDIENLFYSPSPNSFLIFTDKKIEGQTHEIELSRSYTNGSYYGPQKDEFSQYIIELHSITKEGYTYLRTIDLQKQSSSDQEPVLSYTNIENGIGIFTGYSASQIIINKGVVSF